MAKRFDKALKEEKKAVDPAHTVTQTRNISKFSRGMLDEEA
jgi:hypothetical protein